MRPLLVLSAFLGCASTTWAALDQETKTPYHLRVVVSFASHPDFTEFFRQDFKRELQGNLQAALGLIGTVEVLEPRSIHRDKWEPLWLQVEQQGLESLDSFKQVGGGKTHFLRIDCAEGQYQLQARQIDGTSGFPTPIVRKNHTHSRCFVSRLAGLMIARDFGIIGTVEPGAGQNVYMRLKAGALGPVDKWVKPGDVFAVVAISRSTQRTPAPKGQKGPAKTSSILVGERTDGVLLKVLAEPKDGLVSCQIFNRYAGLPISGVIGYRCVRLGTIEAPLRLQLLDQGGSPHKAAALQVYARGEDFPDSPKASEQTTIQDNVFVSRERFSNVAFVRVMLGNRGISRIPIEILDDRVQIRKIQLDPNAELRYGVDSDRRSVLGRITDGRLIQVQCFHDILALEKANQKQQALDRGSSVLKSLDASCGELQEEIDKLRERSTKEAPTLKMSLADCDQQLLLLRAKQDELRKHLEALTVAIAEEKDPNVVAKKKRVQDTIRQAELLIAQAEYDQALKAYEQALAEVQSDAAAKQKIEVPYQTLKKAWAIREGDPAHSEARRFICDLWPKLGGLKEFGEQLPRARLHFEKCKSVGDRLAINKMHLASVEVATRFGDELKKLIDSAMEEEDKKALEKFQKVNEDLQKLLRDMDQVLVKK